MENWDLKNYAFMFYSDPLSTSSLRCSFAWNAIPLTVNLCIVTPLREESVSSMRMKPKFPLLFRCNYTTSQYSLLQQCPNCHLRNFRIRIDRRTTGFQETLFFLFFSLSFSFSINACICRRILFRRRHQQRSLLLLTSIGRTVRTAFDTAVVIKGIRSEEPNLGEWCLVCFCTHGGKERDECLARS